MVEFMGIHGVVTGMHGIGVRVNTPNAAAVAAAVAAATVGFAREVHIPKDMMFIIGTKSAMIPTGRPHAKIGVLGTMARGDGAHPHEHWHIAPQTAIPIVKTCSLLRF